mmetsp:Transcript_17321/g.40347  ORF Transcript_17321/g.40347 Transcript_17321/m.40347 type:complete len:205 (+) Transcript_17321:1046-1660(+)
MPPCGKYMPLLWPCWKAPQLQHAPCGTCAAAEVHPPCAQDAFCMEASGAAADCVRFEACLRPGGSTGGAAEARADDPSANGRESRSPLVFCFGRPLCGVLVSSLLLLTAGLTSMRFPLSRFKNLEDLSPSNLSTLSYESKMTKPKPRCCCGCCAEPELLSGVLLWTFCVQAFLTFPYCVKISVRSTVPTSCGMPPTKTFLLRAA